MFNKEKLKDRIDTIIAGTKSTSSSKDQQLNQHILQGLQNQNLLGTTGTTWSTGEILDPTKQINHGISINRFPETVESSSLGDDRFKINIGDILIAISTDTKGYKYLSAIGKFDGYIFQINTLDIILKIPIGEAFVNPSQVSIIRASNITDEYIEMFYSEDPESVALATTMIAEKTEINNILHLM